MNSGANALRVVSVADEQPEPAALPVNSGPNPGALLSALATVLKDTITRFDQVSGRVSQNILTRGNPADHDLIVALQDFDRLQQEFGALSEVFSQCVEVWNVAGGEHAAFRHDPLAAVNLADLKDRLLTRIRNEAIYLAVPPTDANESEIEVF
jgi:hypothetical protein